MFSLRSSYASSQGEAIRRPSRRPTTPKASCCRDLSAGSPTSGRSRNRRAVALNPNLDDAHHRLGNIYLHIGLLDKAIEELRKTLAISPRDDNALWRLGSVYALKGQYDEAFKIVKQADIESNSPFWHYEFAMILLYLGRTDSALAVIRAYLQAHPEDRG